MVDFSAVSAAAGDEAKIEEYNKIVEANASAAGVAQLKEVVSHALRESASRQLIAPIAVVAAALAAVNNALSELPATAQKDVGTEAVRQLFPRRNDDNELRAVDSQIRKRIAALHKDDEEYHEAADMLADVSTDEMSEGEKYVGFVHRPRKGVLLTTHTTAFLQQSRALGSRRRALSRSR